MSCCCNKISESIRIIKLDIANITQSDYSALLMTHNFWNQFYGEKLLIYQEDSFLFHSTEMDTFMEYDYVGAPWNTSQDDNSYGVGNGGFSLRSKSIMLEVIDKVRPESLVLGESTKQYMKNTNSYVLPEDVYFSKSMIDFHIGKVATRNIAMNFSQECVKSINPLGGHNFYLANDYDPSKINLGLIKRTNVVGFYSPYAFTLGGGEKYLSDIMKFFIEKKYQIVFYTNTRLETVINTLKIYEIDIIVNKVQICKSIDLKLINIYNITYDYFIEMSNTANPCIMGNYIPELSCGRQIAHKHIFHCQFPEIIYTNGFNQPQYIDKVIVNSEFTNLYIKQMYNNSCVLYPQCELKKSIINVSKKNNSFITIGRLFPYTKMANNKNIDLIIETFIQLKHLDFTLTIIGSIKNQEYFDNLQKLVKSHSLDNKIIFYVDINDDDKIKLLHESEYYIHATGIVSPKHVMPNEEEHFGISPIEGIMSGCILISADRGYPPYYINHSKNGLLYDSMSELQNILLNICVDKTFTIKREEIYNNIEYVNETFGYKSYISTLTKILMNI
jgi:glycosyltransferase involved in cell wall biosynthesis